MDHESYHPEEPQSTLYGSTMFLDSQHFTVAGGSFYNVTTNYIENAAARPDFSLVPLGNIDLQRSVRLDDSRTIRRGNRGPRVRRVYTAKVTLKSQASTMTVAIYQGDSAQEEWQDDISLYSSVRHPNFLQLFGVANSGSGIYAALFYDELIPFEVFVDAYSHSPVKMVYIYAYCGKEYHGSLRYFNSIFQGRLYHHLCTFWIRPATGRLCTDLTQSDGVRYYSGRDNPKIVFPLNEPIEESWVLDTLTLEEYHDICNFNLRHFRRISTSVPLVLNIAAVMFSLGQDIENAVEIAVLPQLDIPPGEWNGAERGTVVEMQPGWTRYDSSDVMGTTLRLHTYRNTAASWLSQANYIFSHLQIDSNLSDYALVRGVEFKIDVLKVDNPPTGYLFVAPPGAFRSGISTVRWPECPIYWSTDPSGVSRLTPEDANSLGFPGFALTMSAWVNFWDDGVYAGLRQIDQAKGFDPDNQDVARHLGHPLYMLAADMKPFDASEMFSISGTFRMIMNVQLALICFAVLCSLALGLSD